MEGHVSRLEATVEHIDKDLAEIKADQKSMFGVLTDIRVEIAKRPTSERLFGYTATVAALAFAVVAIFVGVLAYLGALPRP